MLSFLIGSGFLGTSTYFIKNSMTKSAEINDNKQKLHSSVVPFSEFNSFPANETILTVINTDPKLKSGILEVMSKGVEKYTKTIIDNNLNIREVERGHREFWKEHSTHKINLNLGFPYLIPPALISDYHFEKSDIVCFGGMLPSALNNYIKNEFDVNLGLPLCGAYLVNYSSCGTGKPVFVIGQKSTDGKFNSQKYGTNKDTIINETFREEQNNADVMFVGGVVSGLLGIFALCGSSISK